MPGISLITPTGGRSESLRRCGFFVSRFIHYMQSSNYECAVQWIVVDDDNRTGPEETFNAAWASGVDLVYLKPKHIWSPGLNTQSLNLLSALPYVKHEYTAFIEDDDYYRGGYVQHVIDDLKNADLVGEKHTLYYNLAQRCYNFIENHGHVALAQTAMRSTLIPYFEEILKASPIYIDVHLWRNLPEQLTGKHILRAGVIGMKGLPGRPGIGIGHKPQKGYSWMPDPKLEKLKSWIGADIELYPANLIA